MSIRPVTVPEMKEYVLKHLLLGYEFKTTEMAPYHTNIRFDVIAIRRWDRHVRIVEIKSCRQDFTADHKWLNYLPYATHFCFAAPVGVIQPAEVPKNFGLVEFHRDNGYLDHRYIRGCKYRGPIYEDYYVRLIEGELARLHPESLRG
jgi:hypothetical protein